MFKSGLNLIKFYYAQRVIGFTPPDEPHFDADSTAYFSSLIRNSKFYMEYGAGGSTILAARLGIPTLTIESDRFFAKKVIEKLPDNSKNTMMVVDIGITKQWGMPLFSRPTKSRLARWMLYPTAPFTHEILKNGDFPDLVLVDGRFRVACALEVARQAQIRGSSTLICVDDYSDNPEKRNYNIIPSYLGAPIMAGRMATFQIREGQKKIAEDDVRESIKNPW